MIERMLKININLNFFKLGLMDSQLEKTYERLVLYMINAAKLLHAQRWKNTETPTIQVKMMQLAEIAKLSCLVTCTFVKDLKAFMDLLLRIGGKMK